jgi:eukaryotic-like serine/threonine-protein kinase
MSVGPGARIGPYEVITLLGEGGMGKVWRARHVSLKRDDALKVLPEVFAADPDRLARFQREAQVLASLNHPNVAHVYGLERADGVQALVMELVEGPTLADRIEQGPVALNDALPIARQIAEALEAAHESGVVHRDLKPANVKLRPDGTVKVLDFGLAKATEPAAASSLGVSQSPTITTQAMTLAGVILGTAAYMAPEQARGKPVDKRADIWAFGAVLYEILTGRKAFDADDTSMTLASVMMKEPDWTALPASTPSGLLALLTRCLKKDPKARLRDIGEARLQIEQLLSGAVDEPKERVVAVGVRDRRAGNGSDVADDVGAVAPVTAIVAAASRSQHRHRCRSRHRSRRRRDSFAGRFLAPSVPASAVADSCSSRRT